MLKEDITIVKICDYNEALMYANSASGKNYLIARNPKIKNSFPLTENYLKNYYNSVNFTGYKRTFKNINCADDTIGYFVSTFGYLPGGSNASGANAAQSSGLNPFFGQYLNLGFDFGAVGSYLWLLLLIGAYVVIKK